MVMLVVGLDKGGQACLQHLALRYLLVRNNLAPWEYATLLDYATERIFLRSVAGGTSLSTGCYKTTLRSRGRGSVGRADHAA
jgi:hypothetical protein